MAYWEFLLQKEGDRDWLPLETAHVEISEGRYRIIAHTSYCEVPVEIRLSQKVMAQQPPRQKTLKRAGQTNANGLMVVIPFTHLTPGRWTVKCGAATSGASEPPDWEYGVQLEVIAIESGVEYWDTELDEEALAEQRSSDTVNPTSESTQSIEKTEQNATSEANPADVVNPVPTLDDAFRGTAPLEDLPLRLQLQHQALVARSRASTVLQGQVTSFSQVEGLPQEGTLWMQLRNPETGAVVHQEMQPIVIAALPHRFEVRLNLPEGISTRLLVGELSLWTATEPPQILAIQGFTVTLNLDALLEVIANQAEQSPDATFEDLATTAEDADPEAADTDGASTATVTPKILPALSPREIPFQLVYLPSTGLTLPPVIYRPMDKKAVGSPSLPPLGNRPVSERPAPTAEEPTTAPAKPLTLPPIGTPRQRRDPVEPASAPPTESGVELPSVGRSHRQAEPASESTPSPETIPAPNPELTFQPDFKGRFWHRLSALAEEAQKAAAEHKARLEAAGVETTEAADAAAALGLDLPNFQDEQGEQNYEVVVYDPEIPEPAEDAAEVASEPTVEVLQPDDPDIEDLGAVPVPELVLPQGELVAGNSLPITVRLPAYPRRLAVKVWVTDIQTRTLVDRPRWLMNWTPAERGEQTSLLQLRVPLGSLEAQFEAIAIDLATQRESYKTTQIRAIVPAGLTDIDLD